MGFSVDIIAFDYRTFTTKIIPSLQEGETNSLVKAEILSLKKDAFPSDDYNHSFNGLKKVISSFDESLSTTEWHKNFAVLDGQIEKTDSPFKTPSRDHWGYQDLCSLFEYMTIKHCAKYHLGLGKKPTLEFCISQQTREIMKKLEEGHNYFQHSSGGFGEGISGWISESETKKLYRLSKKAAINPALSPLEKNRVKGFIKLIEIAAKNNLGLLAGRDLALTLTCFSFGITKLKLNSHISGDGCVNFDGECVFIELNNQKVNKVPNKRELLRNVISLFNGTSGD